MKPITIEQLIDEDFFLQETIEKANEFISQINISLYNYGLEALSKKPFWISMSCDDYTYIKSVRKYIITLYSKAGWQISSDNSTNALYFEIKHPKLEIFK